LLGGWGQEGAPKVAQAACGGRARI
jgi:hypothetical protein